MKSGRAQTGLIRIYSAYYKTMTQDEFRAQLARITGSMAAEEWEAAIESLREDYPHHIKVLERRPALTFNCFAYALKIHDWPFYQRVRGRYEDVFADSMFVAKLILDGILIQAADQDVRVIIYFKDTLPWHAGVLSGTRVVSKWGTGSLVEHGVLEAPLTYGYRYVLYQVPDRVSIESAFEDWAADRRVPVELIKRRLVATQL
jgi:hypothetical protein